MRKQTKHGEHHITVVVHQTLATGTLHDVLASVEKWNDISRDELMRML
jgi:hypothetical protein